MVDCLNNLLVCFKYTGILRIRTVVVTEHTLHKSGISQRKIIRITVAENELPQDKLCGNFSFRCCAFQCTKPITVDGGNVVVRIAEIQSKFDCFDLIRLFNAVPYTCIACGKFRRTIIYEVPHPCAGLNTVRHFTFGSTQIFTFLSLIECPCFCAVRFFERYCFRPLDVGI